MREAMTQECQNPSCGKHFEGIGVYVYPVPDGILPEPPRPEVGLLLCPPCGKKARQAQIAQGLVVIGR